MTLTRPPSEAHHSAARFYALVPCAGIGARAGTALPKQYALVAGQPMVAHTLAALQRVGRLSATLVVLAADDAVFESVLPAFQGASSWLARCGGSTRAQTVTNGLDELIRRGAGEHDWVLVHDAARCLVQADWVERLIEACLDDPVGGLLALPLADTLKHEVNVPDNDPTSTLTPIRVGATLDRRRLWTAQTPQMFRIGMLREALAQAGPGVTDESSAIESLGHRPRLVPGDPGNFKLTYASDFHLAERLLRKDTGMTHPTTRIGEGWDIHQLVAGRPLVLGGVTIPHSHGLLGHSDADALAHAITDALLGAAGLGDIGQHFPETDPAFKDADSMRLLAEAARRVRLAGWSMVNIDATITAQAPKLAPHIPAMRERLAAVLGLPADAVNVKAKTAEQMGPVGEGRAIEARAVCLLTRTRAASA